VSDSYDFASRGPGVWTYELSTGEGGLWFGEPMAFANGMALAASGDALFVCETFARRIARITIDDSGAAAGASVFVDNLPGLPDGIAFDADGNLFVGCYEPSRILRVAPDGGKTEVYIEDATAHLFAHPTNLAFDGSTLFAANLGRWHITRIVSDTNAPPLSPVAPILTTWMSTPCPFSRQIFSRTRQTVVDQRGADVPRSPKPRAREDAHAKRRSGRLSSRRSSPRRCPL
jgi:streptogramin lyase